MKKGVSGAIALVMIILLTMLAIGIVWGIISNTINKSEQNVNYQEQCLNTIVGIVKIHNDSVADYITITLSKGEQIDLVEINAYNGAGEEIKDGSIGDLNEGQKKEITLDGIIPDAEKIILTPYVEKANGDMYACPPVTFKDAQRFFNPF